MHDLIRQLDERRLWADAVLARPVAYRGVGARRDGEAVALTADGEQVGVAANGALDAEVRAAGAELRAGGDAARLVTVELGDREAVAAGLACGGQISVLLQRAAAVPEDAVAALRGGGLVVLATDLASGASSVVDPVGTPPARADAPDERALAVSRLVRGGRPDAVVLDGEVLEAFVPVTRLLLVGSGVLATATTRVAGALGWDVSTVDDAAGAVEAMSALGPGGGLVTFAHRAEVDDPVLTAALAAGVRYVGALGSRRTQAERRERLRAAGVPDHELARVRGPVGLDLGARTPEETALAICAELLSVLTGHAPEALRDTEGAIHR